MTGQATGQAIDLRDLAKSYGDTSVINGITATLGAGEFTVILGPSGCGKSTLLNMIAGLEAVSGGTIRFGPREVQQLPPKDRGCAMVFQNYALYPHMTVGENIGYALKVAGVPRAARAVRVAEAARTVELEALLDRRPSELSGGQRQRVAIARAIVRKPQVLLFDEPLSNLDAKLRHGMRMELSALHRTIGATSVFVTHDQVEAMTLADRVLILNAGRIEQLDTPHAIYHRPATTFVAGFIGAPPMNLMPVTGDGRELRLADGTTLARHPHQGPVTLGIRPEKIGIGGDGVPARIVYREDLGAYTALVARLPGGQEVRVATPVGTELTTGGPLTLAFPHDALHFFDRQTGQRLNIQ
ncbi:MAG: ABC transporter ATP-binding protein [Paracoccaceae bacterium]